MGIRYAETETEVLRSSIVMFNNYLIPIPSLFFNVLYHLSLGLLRFLSSTSECDTNMLNMSLIWKRLFDNILPPSLQDDT
jgi:hypothetical protein